MKYYLTIRNKGTIIISISDLNDKHKKYITETLNFDIVHAIHEMDGYTLHYKVDTALQHTHLFYELLIYLDNQGFKDVGSNKFMV